MVAFILPFVFMYQPALLLVGTLPEILLISGTVALGVLALNAAIEGYYVAMLDLTKRVLLFAAGIALFLPFYTVQFAGAALLAAVTAWLWLGRKSLPTAPRAA